MNETIELIAADGARATLQRQGAHLTHWQPAGQAHNALFLSHTAQYAPGVAIRGGVPVIFPQFAALGPLTKHGFARTADWTQVPVQHPDDGRAVARMQLRDSAATRQLWPHPFQLELTVYLSGPCLSLSLDVTNTGDTPFTFTAALHSYLRVADTTQTRVHGLQGLRYRDNVGGTVHTETAAALGVEGEVDRSYFDTPDLLRLTESTAALTIRQQGFTDTVIWNPGAEGAAKLNDLEPGGWRRMLCVEAARVGQPVLLAAGERWSSTQIIEIDTR